MGFVIYSAFVVDDKSQKKLIEKFKNLIQENWKIKATHMIINHGGVDIECKKYLLLPIKLDIDKFYVNENILIVKINNFLNNFNNPHIVIAMGKNVTNELNFDKINWKCLKRPMHVTGKIKEISLNV